MDSSRIAPLTVFASTRSAVAFRKTKDYGALHCLEKYHLTTLPVDGASAQRQAHPWLGGIRRCQTSNTPDDELAAMIHADLSQMDGCPQQGVRVSV